MKDMLRSSYQSSPTYVLLLQTLASHDELEF